MGISIGLSRLLAKLIAGGLVTATRPTPTCVVVALGVEEDRPRARAVAAELRSRGIPTEIAPSAAKFGKQIKFADRRSIPFVWFLGADGASDSVKDIRSGEQVEASSDTWVPPAEDLHPTLQRVEA